MAGRDVKAYLNEMKANSASPEVAQQWATLEEYYNKKLWHQLTIYLETFVNSEIFASGGLIALYENFLSEFELKLNCVSLVNIIMVISGELSKDGLSKSIEFLENYVEKVKNDIPAKILILSNVGFLKVVIGEMGSVKKMIEELGTELETLDGVTTAHAPFYDLCSRYYMIKSDHASYYRSTLRYLGCKECSEIPSIEQVPVAFSLGLAALLGEDVYNFGELLAHPVLQSLKGTNREWLVDILYAFNAGDIAKFEELRPKWEAQADLNGKQETLFAKIRLLALMELIFKRHAHDRTIKFSTISEVARVPIEQVEHLVMKALATELVKGTIDEVSQEVTMTWVQPRVLDIAQVGSLQTRMAEWWKNIETTIKLIKDEVPDVVVS